MKQWQQLKINAPGSRSDDIIQSLENMGALSVTVADAGDQPIYAESEQPPLWHEVVITGLFDCEQNLAPLQQQLQTLTHSMTTETIKEQDWQQQMQQLVTSQQYADRLWVVPSWEDAPNDATAVVKLDPGLAFGTGSHPTTTLCLNWLAENVHNEQNVIDYGCGSGILAIAAIKLGAKKVWAVDNDPQALVATQNNATQNDINPDQLTITPPQQQPIDAADIVIANILANPLIELADTLTGLCKVGGKLVLSGILADQTKNVIQAYQDEFNFEPTTYLEDWSRLVATKL